MTTDECPCGREHVRTKSGVLLSLDNEPGTDPELTGLLKSTLEDPDATPEQTKRAFRRYMFG